MQISWPYLISYLWPSQRKYYINPYSYGLGASGAINSIVSYSILTYPTRIVYIYLILPVPSFIFGLGYMLMDSYQLYYGNSSIGNAAHLSGAFCGASYFMIKNSKMFRLRR
jgi:membrane associated rhomboid family serine protease